MIDDNETVKSGGETPPEAEKKQGAEKELAPVNVEELRKALETETKKAADYMASWQRAQADFINYKRRSEQERAELGKFAGAKALLAVLPVLDDLERALEHVPPAYAEDDWVEGVRLVRRKFLAALEGQGVKPILALGMAFDPNVHEGVRTEPGSDGVVIRELERGYTLNGKVLRPAKVAVGNGQEAPKEAAEEE